MIDAIEKKPSQFAQVQIPIDQIRPNPYQPRKHFDEEKLNELAQSIKEHGIFQPIILKEAIQGYENCCWRKTLSCSFNCWFNRSSSYYRRIYRSANDGKLHCWKIFNVKI